MDSDNDSGPIALSDDEFLELNDVTLRKLQSNDPEAEWLRITDNWIEGAGLAIANNNVLTIIELNLESEKRENGWLEDLCQGIACNRSIKTFELSIERCCMCQDIFRILSKFFECNSNLYFVRIFAGHLDEGIDGAEVKNGIDDYCINILSTALIRNTAFTDLEIHGDLNLTATGWRKLSDALSDPKCCLECLTLGSSDNIGDGFLTCLGFALERNKTLYSLEISNHSSITSSGWGFFAFCLKNPSSALMTLDLEACNIEPAGAAEIVSALAINSQLKELKMNKNDALREKDWSDLSHILCDKTNIESTYYLSNHTLRTFSIEGRLREDAADYWNMDHYGCLIVDKDICNDIEGSLKMNKCSSEAEVARLKILKHHFPRGGIDIHLFARMSESTLPYAIAWIGRKIDTFMNNIELTVMFNFVQSFPEQFDTRSGSNVVAKKMKR